MMKRLIGMILALLCIGSAASASATQTVAPPYAGGDVFGPDPVAICDDPALVCDAFGTSFVDPGSGEVHLGLDAFVEQLDGQTATSSGLRGARASVSETVRLFIEIGLEAGLRSRLSGIASVGTNAHIEKTQAIRGASARASYTRRWTCTTLSGQRCSVSLRHDDRFGFDVMTISVAGGRRCLSAPDVATVVYEIAGSASVRSLAHATVDVSDTIDELQLTQPDC